MSHFISKNARYEMRNEIELIIKTNQINRKLFYEVSKFEYKSILKKIYYSFCDYKTYPVIQTTTYMWTRLRKELNQTKLIHTNWKDWTSYIDKIDQLIPPQSQDKYYFISDGSWLYEGTLDGIKQILYHYPVFMDDFYICAKDYSWLIIHCEDGGCMFRINQ